MTDKARGRYTLGPGAADLGRVARAPRDNHSMLSRRLRNLFLVTAAFVVVCAGAVWLWVLHSGGVLTRRLPQYRTLGVERTLVEYADGDREHVAVRLEGPRREPVRFTVSLPAGTYETGAQRLPVLMLLSGFATAHRNLGRFPDHGRNAIVSMEYPYDRRRWKATRTS